MDIVCLSYDGNLADAALLAAMGALMRLKLPGTRRFEDEICITDGEDQANKRAAKPCCSAEELSRHTTHSSLLCTCVLYSRIAGVWCKIIRISQSL